jgi:hypothetical protein
MVSNEELVGVGFFKQEILLLPLSKLSEMLAGEHCLYLKEEIEIISTKISINI